MNFESRTRDFIERCQNLLGESQMPTIDIRSLTLPVHQTEGKVVFSPDNVVAYVNAFLEGISGDEDLSVTFTGPGPAWLYLSLWHAAHGVVPDGKINFSAPGVEYTPTAAGPATGDSSSIKDGVIIIDITNLTDAPPPGGRVNFDLNRVADYQHKALALLPAFKVGVEFPEFEVVLTGPGPIWLYLALAAALHSRGGKVYYAAPNAPRVEVIGHK